MSECSGCVQATRTYANENVRSRREMGLRHRDNAIIRDDGVIKVIRHAFFVIENPLAYDYSIV